MHKLYLNDSGNYYTIKLSSKIIEQMSKGSVKFLEASTLIKLIDSPSVLFAQSNPIVIELYDTSECFLVSNLSKVSSLHLC